MNFKQRLVILLATVCFVGKIPFAPGTFGSIAGLPIAFFLSKIDLLVAVICTALFILFAIWIASGAEKILKKKDPPSIVIDETAGIMVTFLNIPFNIFSVAAGFLIFRFFDNIKPPPVRSIEKGFPGGAGVVLDDVAAGIYSNLALRILLFIMF